MGKKLVALITDDHTGEELPENDAVNALLAITTDGTVTEWDLYLAETSHKALLDLVNKFCAHAEPPTTHDVTTTATKTRRNRGESDTGPIRAWHQRLFESLPSAQWKVLGLPEPAAKGRVPEKVIEAYYREHPDRKPVSQDQD